ncbi:MAG: tRNA (N(6)-L-threonylcarbamoyladenosine(37)-C(2))-methylthiotransferase MtaB [Spirochaetaceae bacterium 4572_59]|nr:MAG: tRNA (N(6)-L-threonylcarbamoyladenosine(37)-C(2))-methylthiotransferase MtaB [Spirochaetaceae bacterium 4572_59]
MKSSFFTFGCKLNQCETEALADAFEKQGFQIEEFEKPSDIYVINTCTVTSKSEQKARRIIRKASRDYPESLVIVTGCYAQLETEVISSLGENVLSIPLDQKDLIMDLAGFLASDHTSRENLYKQASFWLETQSSGIDDPSGRFRFSAADFNFHARAFLKIQDGCDNRCAYCRVCLARGSSVSLDSSTVINRLKELENSGYREVVLTGINIDSYSDGNKNLSDLLELILEETQHFRIRLSSLEPKTLLDSDLSILSHPRICPHFHVSAQSGSDTVLERMNRNYEAHLVKDAVLRLRELKSDPFIAADIIAGFPGENDEEHEETIALLKELQFSRIHVFPFSPRPGTAAWDMRPSVPQRIAGVRTSEIRDISHSSHQDYFERWIGRNVDVLLEEIKESDGISYWEGTSGNYLKVRIPSKQFSESDESLRGAIVSCRIELHRNYCCYASAV